MTRSKIDLPSRIRRYAFEQRRWIEAMYAARIRAAEADGKDTTRHYRDMNEALTTLKQETEVALAEFED